VRAGLRSWKTPDQKLIVTRISRTRASIIEKRGGVLQYEGAGEVRPCLWYHAEAVDL